MGRNSVGFVRWHVDDVTAGASAAAAASPDVVFVAVVLAFIRVSLLHDDGNAEERPKQKMKV